MDIGTEERDFFMTLRGPHPSFRKVHNITQVPLEQALSLSQQTVQAYKVGRRRVQVSNVPVVAKALPLILADLFDESAQASRSRLGPALKSQQIEAVIQLPKLQPCFASQMLAGGARV